MMKKLLSLSLWVIIMFTLSGCGSTGAFRGINATNVELSRANFNLVAKDLEGSAMQGYLFGLSAPVSHGSDIASMGIVRISGDDKPYAMAVKRLWDSYKETYGDPEGKKLALVNIRHDSEVLNLLVYTEAKIFITADVVEFLE